MGGFGESNCGFLTSGEIMRQWPKLKSLPRPEPDPKLYPDDHKLWLDEYPLWKDLKCKSKKGYFCRRHGRWITCKETDAGLASGRGEKPSFCPHTHDEFLRMIEDFNAGHRAHLATIMPPASSQTQVPLDDQNQQQHLGEIAPSFAALSLEPQDDDASNYPPQPGYGDYGESSLAQQAYAENFPQQLGHAEQPIGGYGKEAMPAHTKTDRRPSGVPSQPKNPEKSKHRHSSSGRISSSKSHKEPAKKNSKKGKTPESTDSRYYEGDEGDEGPNVQYPPPYEHCPQNISEGWDPYSGSRTFYDEERRPY